MAVDEGALQRLARIQTRYYLWVVVLGLVIAAAAVPLVQRLGLNSDWTALLPHDKPSVRDLEMARGRVGGLNTLTVCIQSRDLDAMQRLARDLVPRLERLAGDPANRVRSVEWNVGTYEDFVYRHRHLYAGLDDLNEVHDALAERLDYERLRHNPLWVDLGDEPPPDPAEVVARLQKKADDSRRHLARFPGGFYASSEHKLLAIFLRTDLGGGDAEGAHRLIAAVNGELAALRPGRYARDMKVEYAGDLIVASEEHDAIAKELVIATLLTIGLCLVAIYVFFLRARAIPILGLSLAVPVLVTFGIAEVTVDYLNTATAFLGSIVVGNGINPMIIWLARYFEERRTDAPLEEIVARTHRGVWLGTLGASAAAAIAYGSLVVTDFRGFRDFGIIGGIGMILCWAGAMLLLPAVAVLFDRIRPMKRSSDARPSFYGRVSRKAVLGAPRAILVISAVVAIAGIALVTRAVLEDPIEYNFYKLRSVRETSSRAGALNWHIKEMGVGAASTATSLVLFVPRRADTAPLRREMERRRDREHAPWGDVRTIDDLLPRDQAAKLPVLREIRAQLVEAREYATDEDRRRIDENIPPENIRALVDADLPESVARAFTERNGTRGRILFVEPAEGPSVWDGRYLIEWSRALRTLRLPDGSRPPLIGRAPIFADMLEVVLSDGPRAVAVSFLATCVLLLVSFRRMRERLLALAALLFGVVWMTGAMAAFGMKLNFLNFVALPITFGIGVDYAVNVMRRYTLETRSGASGSDAVRAALDETGGAVILCSLTTIFGYISLLTSANLALNSFGGAMTISEITCLAAAILTMPGALLLLARRRAA